MSDSYNIKLAHHITNREKRLKEDEIEKVVVGAIITADQKILVLRRQSSDFMGDLVSDETKKSIIQALRV